jgi:hypothetical protein
MGKKCLSSITGLKHYASSSECFLFVGHFLILVVYLKEVKVFRQ